MTDRSNQQGRSERFPRSALSMTFPTTALNDLPFPLSSLHHPDHWMTRESGHFDIPTPAVEILLYPLKDSTLRSPPPPVLDLFGTTSTPRIKWTLTTPPAYHRELVEVDVPLTRFLHTFVNTPGQRVNVELARTRRPAPSP